ncbi:ORF38 [Ictalurid herpesvirus 1]|uniref:Uncharacterized protein ORF38 n=1 Tax=Ictalurid herpesvirus 1 (strain Auburn) TaxID=766178 RepID=VG38_ICHVA|nr:ORF38 [Ictalurid herpesvirus 1]Q00144.1 RecName: Full=Uncharacterized protein ORF38 [Ictalurid herpesvirus 1 (strain Auburn)]AAA88141.1 ORF38 [Ictalurid herpesvirus 1]
MSVLGTCCCWCPNLYIAMMGFFRRRFTKTQVYDILSANDPNLTPDISMRAVDHYRQAARLTSICAQHPAVMGTRDICALEKRAATNIAAGNALMDQLNKWTMDRAENSTTNLVGIINDINS